MKLLIRYLYHSRKKINEIKTYEHHYKAFEYTVVLPIIT